MEFCLCAAPLGAPAAAQLMDFLISCGCKKIISTGSCGVLTDLAENEFLIPVKALRDEGTSYHYLPGVYYMDNGRVLPGNTGYGAVSRSRRMYNR